MMEKTLYKRACTHCGHMTGQFHYNDEEVERLEKVVSLYSALFRGVTSDKRMLILPKDAYNEINAAIDALKEG